MTTYIFNIDISHLLTICNSVPNKLRKINRIPVSAIFHSASQFFVCCYDIYMYIIISYYNI